MGHVPEVRKQVGALVEQVWSMHGGSSTSPLPWPVEQGGTFHDIALRFWGDKPRAMDMMLSFLQGMHIVSSTAARSTLAEDISTVSPWPLEGGFNYDLSVLVFNFENVSLWRNFLPLPQALPIAVSIAFSGFTKEPPSSSRNKCL